MSYHRQTVNRRFFGSALVFFLSFWVVAANAQDGKAIFNQKCATCHSVFKELVGPALGGLEDRGPWGDRKKLYAWIHNPGSFMANDPYTQGLKASHNGVIMTAFPDLKEPEIDAVVSYINTTFAAGPGGGAKPGGGGDTAVKEPEADHTLLFGVLTLILAVVALTLLQVNSNLKKMSDDKEGVPASEPVPFFRNK